MGKTIDVDTARQDGEDADGCPGQLRAPQDDAWGSPQTTSKCEAAGGSDNTSKQITKAPADRERLCNEILNTSVMAALIGGFAFSNLQSLKSPLEEDSPPSIDVGIYMLNVIAVHMCTCSCLMSAFLYTIINRLEDECVATWAGSMPWKILLPMPMGKFGMGCVFYLVSVLLVSYRDLENVPGWRYVALCVGVGSVISVFMTGGLFMLKG